MRSLGIKPRDLVLIIALLLLSGGLFLYFTYVTFAGESSYAYVFYGSNSQPIVTVDFDSAKAKIIYEQEVPETYNMSYPFVEEGTNEAGHAVIWVTLLGDYEIDDIRQELVVEFDLDQKSIQIVQEESPLNICSRQGISTNVPLICLPNRIRVEFVASDDTDIDYLS